MAFRTDNLLGAVRQLAVSSRASLASTARNQITSSSIRQLHQSPITRASYRRFGDAQYASGGGSRSIIPGNNIAARVRNLPPVVYVAVAGGGVYYVYHLERTETGRLRFMDVTEVSERQMGDMATQEILQQYGNQLLSENHPTTRYVRKVADRILAASGLDSSTHGQGALKEISDRWSSSERKQGVDWKVRVINDDSTRNAFVLPNGAIFVFTGILPICANEDGLAAVLGHEVAHQVARHAGEKMSSQKVYSALSYGALFLGIDPSITSPAIGLLLSLPNSRAAESEADHIGLKLASRACYNAAEAVNMWKRMQAAEGSGGMNVGFLSTHPPNETRIKQITKWLPEVEQIRADSCGQTGGFARGFNAVTANFR